MTDNNLRRNTTYLESENNTSEHKSHHSSHHSNSHHRSSHHHSSGHSHSNHKHLSRNKRPKANFSLAYLLEDISMNRVSRSIPLYRKVSQRVLFCIIFFGLVAGAIMGVVYFDETPTASKPGYARSEADQLRSQITILQLEKAELEKELDEYKRLYGELKTIEPDN